MSKYKLIPLPNKEFVLVEDYNTTEAYDSRIKKGTLFYKDDSKSVAVAEYSPASSVSRPIVAISYDVATSYGLKPLPLIDKKEVKELLENREYRRIKDLAERIVEIEYHGVYHNEVSCIERGAYKSGIIVGYEKQSEIHRRRNENCRCYGYQKSYLSWRVSG